MTWSAWMLAVAQIPFIVAFLKGCFGRKKAADNPWEATTLEWAAPTPPPHGNFAKAPVVHRGPYEYSVPGHSKDFTMQHLPERA
jgi:cytochrome c oxidase subunit 1